MMNYARPGALMIGVPANNAQSTHLRDVGNIYGLLQAQDVISGAVYLVPPLSGTPQPCVWGNTKGMLCPSDPGKL